jgi:hypothetical protein
MDEEALFNHDRLLVKMCIGEYHSSRGVNRAMEIEVMVMVVEIRVRG